MFIRIWTAGEHEIVQTVLRERREPEEELTLEDPAGEVRRWKVLHIAKDPHGWLTTATRCLPGCREHTSSGGTS